MNPFPGKLLFSADYPQSTGGWGGGCGNGGTVTSVYNGPSKMWTTTNGNTDYAGKRGNDAITAGLVVIDY